MNRRRWYAKPLAQFVGAVSIVVLALVVVNPFMSNDRIFGQEPWSYIGLFLPVLAVLAFMHFAVPAEHRASPARYLLRVVVVSALACGVAIAILVIAAVGITGEFI